MEQNTSSRGTVEAPKIRLEVPIMCGYMKSMLISTDLSFMGYPLFAVILSDMKSDMKIVLIEKKLD